MQDLGQLGVAIEAVEGDGGHAKRLDDGDGVSFAAARRCVKRLRIVARQPPVGGFSRTMRRATARCRASTLVPHVDEATQGRPRRFAPRAALERIPAPLQDVLATHNILAEVTCCEDCTGCYPTSRALDAPPTICCWRGSSIGTCIFSPAGTPTSASCTKPRCCRRPTSAMPRDAACSSAACSARWRRWLLAQFPIDGLEFRQGGVLLMIAFGAMLRHLRVDAGRHVGAELEAPSASPTRSTEGKILLMVDVPCDARRRDPGAARPPPPRGGRIAASSRPSRRFPRPLERPAGAKPSRRMRGTIPYIYTVSGPPVRRRGPVAMLPAYAELHCLTNFTFLRGASHPEELVERAHALGYAALAITDECSVAGVVRAHLAAKDAGLPLIIGSEFTLADGRSSCCSPPTAELRRSRRSSSRAAGAAPPRAATRSTRDDVAALASRCLALWLPALDPLAASRRAMRHATRRAGSRDVSRGRAWIARRAVRARGRSRAARAAAQRSARDSGLPLVAAGDVHMHVRARRALQDTLTAIRLRTPLAAMRATRCIPTASATCARAARLATIYPRELLAETLDVAERCAFSLDELRYEYPEELVPRGRDAGLVSAQAHRGGPARGAIRAAALPADVRELIEHELALIAELRYEPYFLTVHDIVAFARSAGHPVPGTRLGGELRGLLLRSASPRSIPARMTMLFERFISQGAQRAARHRRRLRAPAARGSDAVRLPQVRPRPRGARRDAHHATGRRARCATSARRSASTSRRSTASPASFAWWDGRAIDPRAPPRSRLRSRQPA